MKNLKQKIVSFTLILGAFMLLPITAVAEMQNESILEEISIAKDDLIGGWEYVVEGAPEGYDKGFMMIVNQSGIYKVQVQLNGTNAVNGENVVVKGNKITFTITVEGDAVVVSLEAKGSKITGTSTSSANGVMKITAVKSISPQ